MRIKSECQDLKLGKKTRIGWIEVDLSTLSPDQFEVYYNLGFDCFEVEGSEEAITILNLIDTLPTEEVKEPKVKKYKGIKNERESKE